MNKTIVSLIPNHKRLLSIALVMLIIVNITLACSLPFKIVWTGDTSPVQESADQGESVEEQAGEAPQEGDVSDSGMEDAIPSDTPTGTPTGTPSITPSPTITLTPTPEILLASVKQNTNCRLGPKDIYDLIHIFKKGDTVVLLGKNQEDSFWYVQDQPGGAIECWMWNEYTTPGGGTENLPVFTPPPSPIPVLSFTLSYKNTAGDNNVYVFLANTGNLPLESYSATFKDINTSEVVTKSNNAFGSMSRVSVGNGTTIMSPDFSASTIGHSMKATVKACTQDGQSGKCTTVSIDFVSQ